MMQANVLEAKNGLSGFIRMIESGQEDCIVIARRNKPVARLVGYEKSSEANRIGVAKGETLCADDWDFPEINAEIATLFGSVA